MNKVLIIEDDLPILDNIIDTLTAEGFLAKGAANGLEGIEAVQTFVPDLIICDISMPGLDGYGVLHQLRNNPATVNIPFVFLTSRIERQDLRRGMESGADDYIPKPYTRSELLKSVSMRLKKQEPYKNLQQEYERVSHSDQLKTEAIRVAAHDLRNPLTSVSMTLYLLIRVYGKALPPEVLEKLNRIEAASNQMEQITSEILSVDRIEMMKVNRSTEVFDLNEIVQAEFDNFIGQAKQKDQRLRFEKPAQPTLIQADPIDIKHVVLNLISNAVKYMPTGGYINLLIKHEPQQVLFVVQDNGCGIPKDQQDRLFEAFYRVKTQETSTIGGTGLGLHLAKKMIERNRGKLLFRSVYGKGSVFGFWMPPAPSDSDNGSWGTEGDLSINQFKLV